MLSLANVNCWAHDPLARVCYLASQLQTAALAVVLPDTTKPFINSETICSALSTDIVRN
jgi:hypothetical protein